MDKYPPIPEQRRRRYEELWQHSQSIDGVPDEVRDYLLRLKTLGIEQMSSLNKDYLGAFMAPFSRDLENADLAIIGAPFEKSAPVNASHKYGPSALRKLSKLGLSTVSDSNDIPFDWCRVIDYGNVDTYGQLDLSSEMELLIHHMRRIVVEHGVTPFVWGGDHSVTYAPINALAERYGPLGLIHFDAHYDLVTYADFPYPYHSGNMFARSFAEGNLDPERMITMGIRGRMSALVGGHPQNFGVTTYTADECRELGARAMAEKTVSVVGDGPVYLTLDLDCLDPAFNSSSSSVEPFGLTTWFLWDVIRTVRESGKVNLVGADVVEYAPMADPTSKDGYHAVGLSWKIFCWLAAEVARRNGEKRKTEWPLAMGYASL